MEIDWESYIVGSVISAIGAGIVTGILLYSIQERVIPKTKEVQAGYIAPNKLEIAVDDLDDNGEQETIMKVDGKPYLLKYDINNKPIILNYEETKY